MWWGMLGGAIAGYFGNDAARAQADANTRISAANAKAGNEVRQASNAFEAAKGNLARYAQSVSNNQRLKAGGDAIEANVVNYRRARDNLGLQSFSTSIKQAEQAGASAAAQANSGIDGSVVDQVNGATALRDSIVDEAIRRNGETMDFDAAHRAAGIEIQTVQGMDGSLILDQLDFNQDFAQVSPKISAFAAAVRGAFPYKDDMIGKSGDATQKTDYQTNTQYTGGLGTRQQSNNNYDLADYSYSKNGNATFGFKDNSEQSPYQLWGANNGTSLGDHGDKSQTSDSMYALWSR